MFPKKYGNVSKALVEAIRKNDIKKIEPFTLAAINTLDALAATLIAQSSKYQKNSKGYDALALSVKTTIAKIKKLPKEQQENYWIKNQNTSKKNLADLQFRINQIRSCIQAAHNHVDFEMYDYKDCFIKLDSPQFSEKPFACGDLIILASSIIQNQGFIITAPVYLLKERAVVTWLNPSKTGWFSFSEQKKYPTFQDWKAAVTEGAYAHSE